MSEANNDSEEITREEYEEIRERLDEIANDKEEVKEEKIKLLQQKVDILNDQMASMVTTSAVEAVLEETGLEDDHINEMVRTIKQVDQELRWDVDE